jgi:hypothetical protein
MAEDQKERELKEKKLEERVANTNDGGDTSSHNLSPQMLGKRTLRAGKKGRDRQGDGSHFETYEEEQSSEDNSQASPKVPMTARSTFLRFTRSASVHSHPTAFPEVPTMAVNSSTEYAASKY